LRETRFGRRRTNGANQAVDGERDEFWERVEPLIPRCAFARQGRQASHARYDELEGIEWEWQSVDGVMSKAPTKAPLGKGASGQATGKNPTDRAKMGTKRSMLTDGAGIPLAVALEGANRHDSKLCWLRPWTG
jgi:hypothetical protein